MLNKIWEMIEILVIGCLELLFRVLKKELTQETKEAFLQFVKFGMVGVTNTLVNYVIYAVSLIAMKEAGVFVRFNYLIAQGIAFLLSVLWSYYWNGRFVFKQEEGTTRNGFYTLLKTYVSYSFTGLFLNSILLMLWISVFHISDMIAPIINLIVTIPLNFIINKFWAFKTKKVGGDA